MMRLTLFLTCLLLAVPSLAQQRFGPIQYGAPATIPWWFFNDDGRVDTDEADDGAGDSECTLSKDHAAPGAIAAQYAYDTDSDVYRLALTATEAEFGIGHIICPQAGETNEIIEITTFGDLNAYDKTRGIASGVAQSGTSTTIVLDASTSIADDRLIGAIIYMTCGTGAGQRARISDWVSSIDTATISTEYVNNVWLTNPSSDTCYMVQTGSQGLQACDASGVCDSNEVQTAGDATAATTAKNVFNGTGASLNASTINLPDGGLTAAKTSADFQAEVQSEAEDALIAHNLDHIVGTATGIPAVVAGTYLDQILDDGTQVYDRATDSMQAIRDRGDAAWTEISAAEVRAAVGLTSANLDTQLAAIDDFVDTEVATAVSQTTAVAIRGAVGLGAANLDTQLSAIDDYVDGEIAAILSAVQLFAGTADGGTVATLEDAALNQADTNYWAFGAAIRFTSGNLAGQTRCVDSFTPGGSAALAFSPPVSQPVSTHDYLLIPAPACDPFR